MCNIFKILHLLALVRSDVFGGTYHFHLQGNENLITLKMEAICYSETSALVKATQCNISEDIHKGHIVVYNTRTS
jgi:hypothetical protein